MPTIATLLAALRYNADPQHWLAQVAPLDQDDLVITALGLGLAPFLHYQLEQWGATLPQPAAQAKLIFARKMEAQRHAALTAQLAEVLPRLPTPPILLKGAYLAEHLYPAPGLRPMNDIDLLFRPADLPAVAQVLHDLGYGSKEKSSELGPGITKHTSTFKKAGSAALPNPYLAPPGQRMIEPHRSLEEAWFGLKCDLTPGMWERSESLERARALKSEDNLLHLCVHLAFHLIMGAPSFVQLLDVAGFTQWKTVDWEDFMRRAEGLRAVPYAYAALRLAALTLAAPIPAEVLRRLAQTCSPAARAVAESLSLEDIVRRTQQPPLRTLAQRLRRGVTDRYETARWAQSLGEWGRVWWSLVDVTRTDTWKLLTQSAP